MPDRAPSRLRVFVGTVIAVGAGVVVCVLVARSLGASPAAVLGGAAVVAAVGVVMGLAPWRGARRRR